MKNRLIGQFSFWLTSFSLLFLTGCGGGGSNSTSSQQSVVSLTVSAGLDLDVTEVQSITLNGQASVTNGSITGYHWSQISGPTVTLTDADTLRATFSVPDTDSDQQYEFRLLVTEQGGTSKSDTVVISATNNGSFHYAKLGPLKSAGVKVYGLGDLDNYVYQTVTGDDGDFFITNNTFDPGRLYLVSVTGGVDLDKDDDGIQDDAPVTNYGTINALVLGEQLTKRGGHVSALTDIAWQYSKSLIDNQTALKIRLDDLSRVFIDDDLNGDAVVDSLDFWAFDPQQLEDKEKLQFDYAILFEEQNQNKSIIDAYHSDDLESLRSNLESFFGGVLSLYPTKDSRSSEVAIQLNIFGSGAVSSDDGEFDLMSGAVGLIGESLVSYDASDEAIILTAVPDPGREILSWSGCDTVSVDNLECVIRANDDKSVDVTFVQSDINLTPNFLDLDSAAQVSIESNGDVKITLENDESRFSTMARAIAPGHVLSSTTGTGFLRLVDAVQSVGNTEINLSTSQATLEDLILDGTFVMSKSLSPSDVESAIVEKFGASTSQKVNGSNIHLGNGVIMPKTDGESIIVQFGQAKQAADKPSISRDFSNTVTIEDGNGNKVNISGEIELALELDMAIDFEGAKLEYFKFVPSGTSEQKLEVFFGGEFKLSKKQVKVTTIPYKINVPIVNVSGVTVLSVPVTGNIDIFVGVGGEITAKASIGREFKQSFKYGVIHKRGTDLKTINEGSATSKFIEPSTEFSGEIRPFLSSEISMGIYGKAPAKIPLEISTRIKATLIDTDASTRGTFDNGRCAGGINFVAWLGVESKFEWKPLEGKELSILGRDIDLSFIEADIELLKEERKIKEWNIKGECDEPPFLTLIGDNLDVIADPLDGPNSAAGNGTLSNYVNKYIVENNTQSDLEWSLNWREDSVLKVGKVTNGSFLPFPFESDLTNGFKNTLRPGEKFTVGMSANANAIDQNTTYTNALKFTNLYDNLTDKILSDEDTGTSQRKIKIKVLPDLVAVNNIQIEARGKNTVEIRWDVDENDLGYHLMEGVEVSGYNDCNAVIVGSGGTFATGPCPRLIGQRVRSVILNEVPEDVDNRYFISTFNGDNERPVAAPCFKLSAPGSGPGRSQPLLPCGNF